MFVKLLFATNNTLRRPTSSLAVRSR